MHIILILILIPVPGSGHIVHIWHILHIQIVDLRPSTSAWVDQCKSAIVYERSEQSQVLCVIPVSSILGRLPLWFQWARPGQYPLPCDKNRLAFLVFSAINQQTVMVVDGVT